MLLDVFPTQVGSGNKVLITGHTGFKGMWLTLLLENLGVEVCGLSLEAETNSLYSRLGRSGQIEEKISDIRNFEAASTAIYAMKPSVIFHLAAQPLVLPSYEDPRTTFETNVQGTVNILDSAFRTDFVQTISVITTDKVYENNNSGRKFQESDPLAGKDPYSASKVGTEAAVAAWRQLRNYSSGPTICSLRAGNVIGGGDFAEARLLPDLIKGFGAGQTVEIRNPESTRPWQHVLDPLVGYVMATSSNMNEGNIPAFNFAPDGESLSVGEVAEIARNSWGAGANIKVVESTKKLEAESLQLDANLAKKVLEWKPYWSQEQAIQSTVGWWKSVIGKELTPLEACNRDLLAVLKK
jgi:CDP-glucose 4,6-dehydratase